MAERSISRMRVVNCSSSDLPPYMAGIVLHTSHGADILVFPVT